MSDRELLELAAKAAGINVPKKLSPWDSYSDSRGFESMNMDGSAVKWRWNPMNDDGDALRLAVRLNIRFSGEWSGQSVTMHGLQEFLETNKSDPYAATRRAIVRAAAAIGKEMQ